MRKAFYEVTGSWSSFTSGGKPPAWVSKVIYTCFGPCIEEKHASGKNYICFISMDCRCKKWCFVVGLLITSGEWDKNLRVFGKKDSATSSKLHSTLCRRTFEEKFVFLKKSLCFTLFRILGQKFSDYGWKVYDSFAGITFHVSSQRVYQIGFFERSFTFSGLGAKGSRNSSRKFREGLSELLYTCPENHFEKRFILWKNNFPKVIFGSRV